MKNIKEKTLVIIAGVAGEIGTAFAKSITNQEIDVVGVVRNRKLIGDMNPHYSEIFCDLSNEYEIEKKFGNMALENYSRIIYLHTIGVDKFDPRNYPMIQKMETIPSDIYETNVNTFKYLLRYLAKRIRGINDSGKKLLMKSVIIAGTSDKYTPFVIESFCEAKFILREYIRSYQSRFPDWFSGLSINVTSTVTKSAIEVRPYAKLDYWLTPEEVTERSINQLLDLRMGYEEVDLVKFSPEYNEGYYEDRDLLYEKWSAETGISSPLMETKTKHLQQ
jgi:hypothetical protein